MYCKNFRFAPLKTFWEFQADSEICSKSSNLYGLYITHGFCWIVLEFAKILTNGQNLLTLIKNIDVIISKVSIYNCHICHLIYGSYDAFNTDALDKTTRQKLQFEKVIIPIL